jgi:hypothetical protein
VGRSPVIDRSGIQTHAVSSNLHEQLRDPLFIGSVAEQSYYRPEVAVVLILPLWNVRDADWIPRAHEDSSQTSRAFTLPPCVVLGEIHRQMVPLTTQTVECASVPD